MRNLATDETQIDTDFSHGGQTRTLGRPFYQAVCLAGFRTCCFWHHGTALDSRHDSMKECPYCGAKYPDDATICAIDETPLEEFQSQKVQIEDPQSRKPAVPRIERLWTPYLILCSVFAGFDVLLWLARWQHMNYTWPPFQLTLFRLVVFLTPWALVAIWLKNRWGVVAFVALGIIDACVDLVRHGMSSAIQGLTVYIVFIILVRPQWRKMTWDFQGREDKSEDDQPPQVPTSE
jgi:hypothetical protein